MADHCKISPVHAVPLWHDTFAGVAIVCVLDIAKITIECAARVIRTGRLTIHRIWLTTSAITGFNLVDIVGAVVDTIGVPSPSSIEIARLATACTWGRLTNIIWAFVIQSTVPSPSESKLSSCPHPQSPSWVLLGSLSHSSMQSGVRSRSVSVSGVPQPQAPGAVLSPSLSHSSIQSAVPSLSLSVSGLPQPHWPAAVLLMSLSHSSMQSAVPSPSLSKSILPHPQSPSAVFCGSLTHSSTQSRGLVAVRICLWITAAALTGNALIGIVVALIDAISCLVIVAIGF